MTLLHTETIEQPPELYTWNGNISVDIQMLKDAPPFLFPYPGIWYVEFLSRLIAFKQNVIIGQWGKPTLKLHSFTFVLSSTIQGIAYNFGCYHALARMAQVSTPPVHAINRGSCSLKSRALDRAKFSGRVPPVKTSQRSG